MKKLLILLAASLLSLTKIHAQTDPYNCLKRIKIKAIPYGQSAWVERTMPVYVHYKELTPKEVKKQLQADSARYNGWDYNKLENPSNKMDCAGYTYHNMFTLSGEYWITAGVLYQNIILPYAKQVSDHFSWGDAKPDDIVVFKSGGEAKHISYISSVEKTLNVVTSITIITKDGKEGVYSHRMGFSIVNDSLQPDPIVQALGYPYVYRVNYGNFDINETYFKDCLTPPTEPTIVYKLKEILVDTDAGFAEQSVTAKEYSYQKIDDYATGSKYFFKMTLDGEMPETISPGEKFEIPVTIQTSKDNLGFDNGMMVNWYCDAQLVSPKPGDRRLWVGKMDGVVKKSIRESLTITTPDCNPQQLICCFQRAYGYTLGEGTTTRWVRYVYER
jgi:hypothetical protein